MKVRWTTRAREDLMAIAAHIAKDSPSAARNLARRLDDVARETTRFPHIGRRVPESDDAELRERLVGVYRLVYRALQGEILILMVLEGHRLLPEPIE